MKTQINTDHHIAGREALSQQTEATAGAADELRRSLDHTLGRMSQTQI